MCLHAFTTVPPTRLITVPSISLKQVRGEYAQENLSRSGELGIFRAMTSRSEHSLGESTFRRSPFEYRIRELEEKRGLKCKPG